MGILKVVWAMGAQAPMAPMAATPLTTAQLHPSEAHIVQLHTRSRDTLPVYELKLSSFEETADTFGYETQDKHYQWPFS